MRGQLAEKRKHVEAICLTTGEGGGTRTNGGLHFAPTLVEEERGRRCRLEFR